MRGPAGCARFAGCFGGSVNPCRAGAASQAHHFKKRPDRLPTRYMQNPHNPMPQTAYQGAATPSVGNLGSQKSRTPTESVRLVPAQRPARQAMDTAMNASKKISTPPATGNTMGIIGTMDSTTSSDCWVAVWSGFDMKAPNVSIHTPKGANLEAVIPPENGFYPVERRGFKPAFGGKGLVRATSAQVGMLCVRAGPLVTGRCAPMRTQVPSAQVRDGRSQARCRKRDTSR